MCRLLVDFGRIYIIKLKKLSFRMTSKMKLDNLALLPKKKPKKKVAKDNPRIQRELFQRKNIAKPFTFTGKSEVPITGIAPTGYAGGGLGGPGVNVDNVREFLTELDAFEKEFGYGK